MCIEFCFECQEPCWPVYDDLPGNSGIPATESKNHVIVVGPPCHSFERPDDAQPAERGLQENKNGSVPEGEKLPSGISSYEKPWYVVGD